MPLSPSFLRYAGAAMLLIPTVAGCAAEQGETVLTVYAAASLGPAFEEIAADFEDTHDVDVRLALGGSSALAAQLQEGADGDVAAFADEPTMQRLVDDGLASDPRLFATNRLTIAVPTGNPADVSDLADLAGVRLVVCAPEVPCGAAAARVAEEAGVELRPVSEESSVTDVLGKVRSGEADAGLVYVTDVAAADGEVEEVPLPPSEAAVNAYPVAVLDGATHSDLAQEFVDLLLGDGQDVLRGYGFAAAPS